MFIDTWTYLGVTLLNLFACLVMYTGYLMHHSDLHWSKKIMCIGVVYIACAVAYNVGPKLEYCAQVIRILT